MKFVAGKEDLTRMVERVRRTGATAVLVDCTPTTTTFIATGEHLLVEASTPTAPSGPGTRAVSLTNLVNLTKAPGDVVTVWAEDGDPWINYETTGEGLRVTKARFLALATEEGERIVRFPRRTTDDVHIDSFRAVFDAIDRVAWATNTRKDQRATEGMAATYGVTIAEGSSWATDTVAAASVKIPGLDPQLSLVVPTSILALDRKELCLDIDAAEAWFTAKALTVKDPHGLFRIPTIAATPVTFGNFLTVNYDAFHGWCTTRFKRSELIASVTWLRSCSPTTNICLQVRNDLSVMEVSPVGEDVDQEAMLPIEAEADGPWRVEFNPDMLLELLRTKTIDIFDLRTKADQPGDPGWKYPGVAPEDGFACVATRRPARIVEPVREVDTGTAA